MCGKACLSDLDREMTSHDGEAEPRHCEKKTLWAGKPEAFRTPGGKAAHDCRITRYTRRGKMVNWSFHGDVINLLSRRDCLVYTVGRTADR